MEVGEGIFTSNAVREELAIASPLVAGRKSRDDESRESCGLTNTWTGREFESIRDIMSRLSKQKVRVDLFPMAELTVADVTEMVIDQRRKAINQEK